jgi:hypothetical protein
MDRLTFITARLAFIYFINKTRTYVSVYSQVQETGSIRVPQGNQVS